MAILDSGCSKTVCGLVWFSSYFDTLSVQDKQLVKRSTSNSKFRFGDGRIHNSLYLITMPFYVCDKKHFVLTDVVSCDVPLLLSRESLERLMLQ